METCKYKNSDPARSESTPDPEILDLAGSAPDPLNPPNTFLHIHKKCSPQINNVLTVKLRMKAGPRIDAGLAYRPGL